MSLEKHKSRFCEGISEFSSWLSVSTILYLRRCLCVYIPFMVDWSSSSSGSRARAVFSPTKKTKASSFSYASLVQANGSQWDKARKAFQPRTTKAVVSTICSSVATSQSALQSVLDAHKQGARPVPTRPLDSFVASARAESSDNRCPARAAVLDGVGCEGEVTKSPVKTRQMPGFETTQEGTSKGHAVEATVVSEGGGLMVGGGGEELIGSAVVQDSKRRKTAVSALSDGPRYQTQYAVMVDDLEQDGAVQRVLFRVHGRSAEVRGGAD